jgi:hypothetical protein
MVEVAALKRVWLVSVPFLALLALFPLWAAPILAGPACAATCGNNAVDQVPPVARLVASPPIGITYAAGGYVLGVVPGQYCSDKTGGQVYVPAGVQPDPGLTCPAVPAGSPAPSASGSPAPSASGSAAPSASSSAAPSAPPASGGSAAPSSRPSSSGSAAPSAGGSAMPSGMPMPSGGSAMPSSHP